MGVSIASQANRKKPIIPKAYSTDLRERLVRVVEGGMSGRKAACQLMIDYSCALKWMGQFRRTGNVQPKRQGLSSESFVAAYGMAAGMD
jgi:transposase